MSFFQSLNALLKKRSKDGKTSFLSTFMDCVITKDEPSFNFTVLLSASSLNLASKISVSALEEKCEENRLQHDRFVEILKDNTFSTDASHVKKLTSLFISFCCCTFQMAFQYFLAA